MKKITFFLVLLLTLVVLLGSGYYVENKVSVKPAIQQAKADTILIITMNFKEKDLLLSIGNKITSFYNIPVKYKESHLPQFAYYSSRNRFKADSLIKYVKYLNNGKYKFVVGLTSSDIATTNDWGVFGLASLDASGCISSTFRLKKGVTNEKLRERIQKIVLHEIGHNCGLYHCTTPYPCFMKAAKGKISVVDLEPMDVCSSCRNKLRN